MPTLSHICSPDPTVTRASNQAGKQAINPSIISHFEFHCPTDVLQTPTVTRASKQAIKQSIYHISLLTWLSATYALQIPILVERSSRQSITQSSILHCCLCCPPDVVSRLPMSPEQAIKGSGNQPTNPVCRFFNLFITQRSSHTPIVTRASKKAGKHSSHLSSRVVNFDVPRICSPDSHC